MKIRNGFVSNSSSMSFVISTKSYENVFALAKRMIDIMIKLDSEKGYDDWIDSLEEIKRRLEERETLGMDPNTSVQIPSCNYDTFIERDNEDHCYRVDTCNNHNYWEGLEGDFLLGLDSDFDCSYDLDEKTMFNVSYDIMAKNTYEYCEKHFISKIKLENGEIVCKHCNPEKLEKFKLAVRFGNNSLDEIMKRLSR